VEPEDQDERAYLKYRDSLQKAEQESMRSFDRGILTLAAGAFGLSIATLGVIPPSSPHATPRLLVAWGLFGLALAAILTAFLTAQAASRSLAATIDRAVQLAPESWRSAKSRWISVSLALNVLSIASLLFAFVFWLSSVSSSLHGGLINGREAPDKKPTTTAAASEIATAPIGTPIYTAGEAAKTAASAPEDKGLTRRMSDETFAALVSVIGNGLVGIGLVALAARLAFRYQTRGKTIEMRFSRFEDLCALHVNTHQAGANMVAAEVEHQFWVRTQDTNPKKGSNLTRASNDRTQRIKVLEECLRHLFATIPVTSTLFTSTTQSAWVQIVELHASMKPAAAGPYCIWEHQDVSARKIPSAFLDLLALLSKEIPLPSGGGPSTITVSYSTPSGKTLDDLEPRDASGACEHGYVFRTG